MIPRLKADLRLADLHSLWPRSDRRNAIRQFEANFAALAQQRYAIAFPYGRTALIALLRTLNKPGKEVICPSYTCAVVPHAIVKSGMTPVFVDSDQTDFNMDWEFVQQASNSDTAAVIATSIFGHPTNGDAFSNYRANNPNQIIFQDCAHSFFAGNSHMEGLAAFYGLNISKIITSIFGGMVTTDDKKFADQLKRTREELVTAEGTLREIRRSVYLAATLIAFYRPAYRAVNWLERKGFLDRFATYYDPFLIDLPKDAFCEMGAVEARIGSQQTIRYPQIVSHRRRLAEIYHAQLKNVGDLQLPPIHDDMTVSHFVVRTQKASDLKSICLRNGIQLGELLDYVVSDLPVYQGHKYVGKHRSRVFPPEVINLPVHVGVRNEDAIKICEILVSFFDACSN